MLLLEVIEDSKYRDLAAQASLHGMKLKPRNKPLKMNKEERKEAEAEANAMLERMQERYRNGGK